MSMAGLGYMCLGVFNFLPILSVVSQQPGLTPQDNSSPSSKKILNSLGVQKMFKLCTTDPSVSLSHKGDDLETATSHGTPTLPSNFCQNCAFDLISQILKSDNFW